MANELIKAWDIYVADRKVGTMQKNEASIDAPGTLEQVAEGTIGRAQAPVTSKGTVDTITTFGGRAVTQQLVDACLTNTPVKLTHGPVDGQLWVIDRAWIHGVTQNTDFTSGQATGRFSWEGVAPKIYRF